MHARVTRIRGDAAALQAGAEWFRGELIPQLETISGYRDAVLLVDRAHGESLAITLWDTAEAMTESERMADELRTTAPPAMSGAIAGRGAVRGRPCRAPRSAHPRDRVAVAADEGDHLLGVSLVPGLHDHLDAGLGNGDVDALAVV